MQHVSQSHLGNLLVCDGLTMPTIRDGTKFVTKFVTVWRGPHDFCNDKVTHGLCLLHDTLLWKHVVVSKMGANKYRSHIERGILFVTKDAAPKALFPK